MAGSDPSADAAQGPDDHRDHAPSRLRASPPPTSAFPPADALKKQLGLSYHVDSLLRLAQKVDLAGAAALEIGGTLPAEFVNDVLGVKTWTAVDFRATYAAAGALFQRRQLPLSFQHVFPSHARLAGCRPAVRRPDPDRLPLLSSRRRRPRRPDLRPVPRRNAEGACQSGAPRLGTRIYRQGLLGVRGPDEARDQDRAGDLQGCRSDRRGFDDHHAAMSGQRAHAA